MKSTINLAVLILVVMGLSACLEVSPEQGMVTLAPDQTQVFTATSDIKNVTLVWTLDGDQVTVGGQYTFMAGNSGQDAMVHTLTVKEVGGNARFGRDAASWEITVTPAASWCYMDEDHDGFGNPDKAVQMEDAPADCVDASLAIDCDDTNPDVHPDALETIDGLDNDCNGEVDEAILLHVFSDGWGDLLEVIEIAEQGPVTITVNEENPYSGEQPSYFIYAMQAGHFTQYYYCDYGDTIDVALDPITPGMFNGTIFITQSYFGPTYLADKTVEIYQGDLFILDFRTDSTGRFSIALEPGVYTMSFEDMDGYLYKQTFEVTGDYADFMIPAFAQADKPNIYIYPEQTMSLSVNIAFPQDGYVSQSIPDYGSGWHISVAPDGLIDGQFPYLFYESVQPDLCQYASGWIVKAENLTAFFRENMARTGFNAAEIDDFIEYWIPRLNAFPFYAIYPQYNKEIDTMIGLQFSVQPDSLLRLIYAVKGMEDDRLNIADPVIPSFLRHGFTVVEWGVIQK